MRDTQCEMRDVDARAIVGTAAVLALVIGLVCAVAYGLLTWWERPLGGPNGPLDFAIRPPLLESAPVAARRLFEGEKAELLHGYSWVDEKRGVARIPIDRAMTLMADDGKPAAAKAQQ